VKIDGYTVAELAARLGIPYRTVHMRLRRAGIEPITTGAIYPKSALDVLQKTPAPGRPHKKNDTYPETKPQTFEAREPVPLYIVKDKETGEDVSQVPLDANVIFLDEELVEIPEIGLTAAGSPIDFEDMDPDPPMRLWAAGFIRGDRKNYRCVRVQGSSMTEADIQDGDRALLVRARTAENGEIMLVRDEDSSTLKRIRITEGPDGRAEVWMCWEDGSGQKVRLNGGHQIQARLVAIERKPRKR